MQAAHHDRHSGQAPTPTLRQARHKSRALMCALSFALAGCGGGGGPGDGDPVSLLQSQTITFATAPSLVVGGTATVQASASSGLAVSYASSSTTICSVDASSGVVSGLAAGTCIITADQAGDTTWAAAAQVSQSLGVSTSSTTQSISFSAAPDLSVYDSATLSATASSGLAVSYSSLSPAICSIDATSGFLTALASGTCSIAADQAGDSSYTAAQQVTLTLVIAAASSAVTVPAAPDSVTVSAGSTLASVSVGAGYVSAGGTPITRYTLSSSPAGIRVSSDSLPISTACPNDSCVGYAFILTASNAQGTGQASATTDLLVDYDVHVMFEEPSYTYDNTEFRGSFTYNASQRSVSALEGDLSEVMAGYDLADQAWPDGMPLLHLSQQLVSESAGSGLLVGSFLLENTLTLSTDARDNGVANGWQPGSGNWKYYGYAHGDLTAANPGNAYALIYVNTDDPTSTPTQTELDLLAYADCHEQGMMGDDCMTGTTVAGYGTIGSMGGYPISQRITRK